LLVYLFIQTAASKVFEDEVGMFPKLMTFMSQSDKLTRMTLVSKTFNKVVHLPESWRTVEVVNRNPDAKCPVTKTHTIRTILFAESTDLRHMPVYAEQMENIEHLLVDITASELNAVAATWPKLQTLYILDKHATSDEFQRAATTLLSMKCLRDLRLDIPHFTPQTADWEAFESIEKFTGYLNDYTSNAIVTHGGKLRRLCVEMYHFDRTEELSSMAAVMAIRGAQLELLDLDVFYSKQSTANEETDRVLDAIAEHSGRLRALRISGISVCKGNIEKVLRVVAANQLTLRALSAIIFNEYTDPVPFDGMLQTMYALCGGRLEYVRVHVHTHYLGPVYAHYHNVPGAVAALFRFTDVSVNNTSLVEAADQVAELHTDESTVVKMYADGLSLYPARV
jgi:hypothetical protein